MSRKYLPLIHPRFLVLCLFLENDLDETQRFHEGYAARFENRQGEAFLDGLPLARERHHKAGWLFRSSALYRYLRLRLASGSINMGGEPFKEGWLDVYLKDPPEWVANVTKLAHENLDRIQAACRDEGTSLAIVLIPSDLDSRASLWEATIRRSPLGPEAYDPDRPFVWMERYAESRGIPLLDLRPAFRAASGSLHYKHDRHFNAAGHALAASEIARFLDSP